MNYNQITYNKFIVDETTVYKVPLIIRGLKIDILHNHSDNQLGRYLLILIQCIILKVDESKNSKILIQTDSLEIFQVLQLNRKKLRKGMNQKVSR